MTRFWRARRLHLAWIIVLSMGPSAPAVTITVDYKYDLPANGGSNFFGSGNPQGAAAGGQARSALDAAAGYFSTILGDTFSPITIPAPYNSTAPGSTGKVTWNWEQRFQHPSGSSQVTVTNATLSSNQYVVYAGARNMTGIVVGEGGPGGTLRPAPTVTGTNSFTQSDINTINSITANFDDAIFKRGQSSGFARWGGTVSFDNSARLWHFDHSSPPSAGTTDFFSVAIHELAHALGFGERDDSPEASTAWEQYISGNAFYGPNALAAYGGAVPLSTLDPEPNHNNAHWSSGVSSVLYGTSLPQETAMDPDISPGTRQLFTTLDVAGMRDIGWTVVAPPVVYGDYNNNGIVDAADYAVWRKRLNQNVTIPNDATPGNVNATDYTVWRTNFGKTPSGAGGSLLANVPEPGAALLAVLAGVGVGGTPRKRRR